MAKYPAFAVYLHQQAKKQHSYGLLGNTKKDEITLKRQIKAQQEW
ncbi:hypothetical protein ACFS7Z_25735 [Pontibacter toksunensis]|uniref:Uncharacterized protein n=1 Tax=Pontibacter toksunensis TaxID=1332631 RepID=A0ABW6C5Y2_9BACT